MVARLLDKTGTRVNERNKNKNNVYVCVCPYKSLFHLFMKYVCNVIAYISYDRYQASVSDDLSAAFTSLRQILGRWFVHLQIGEVCQVTFGVLPRGK